MSPREIRIERIESVYRESLAAAVAVDLLGIRLRAEPSFLASRGLKIRAFRDLENHLDATYLIRLFAEYESTLRSYWRDGLRLETVPRTKDLMDAIAARRGIGRDLLEHVHNVREFRNSLVHEDHGSEAAVSLEESQQRLRSYLARLPNSLRSG